jgi:hypothetical protein
MKSIFASNNEKKEFKVFGFELLSEQDMFKVRGGDEKPKSRPKDDYPVEEE